MNFTGDLGRPICLQMDARTAERRKQKGTLGTMWRKMLQRREIMKRTQTDKRKSHRMGRWKRWWGWGGEGEGEREREKRERGEREAARFMPLSPRSKDSSLGGTQTLSPCPALYSPGNCSQINLAGYPVELSPVQPSVAPPEPPEPPEPSTQAVVLEATEAGGGQIPQCTSTGGRPGLRKRP